MAEEKESRKEIFSISEREVEQILTLLPDLQLIEKERPGILAKGTVEVRAVKSEDQGSILDLFVLEVHLQDHRGLGAPERNFPRFCLPVPKTQLLDLLHLLEKMFRPSFEDRVLDLLGKIEKKLPE